jgi:hypothetical protein
MPFMKCSDAGHVNMSIADVWDLVSLFASVKQRNTLERLRLLLRVFRHQYYAQYLALLGMGKSWTRSPARYT